MKHLLEEDEYFTYVSTHSEDGIDYEIYLDDYGQSFVIAYRHPKTTGIVSMGCGSYNGYEDTLDYLIRTNRGED